MDGLTVLLGVWLARLVALYGLIVVLLPAMTFAHAALLGVLVWAAVTRTRRWSRGDGPGAFRSALRLALEIVYGLLNPILYLTVLIANSPAAMRGGAWREGLIMAGWIVLAAIWGARIFGAAWTWGRASGRIGLRLLLGSGLLLIAAFGISDAWGEFGPGSRPLRVLEGFLRIGPLYLIPALLLMDHLRALSARSWLDSRSRFFLLPGTAARRTALVAAALAIVTVGAALHRRSDASVRALVHAHRAEIAASAAQYGVDPRLIASIVYVTHRDQLSPFRDTLERVAVAGWAGTLNREPGKRGFGLDSLGAAVASEMLNQPLDLSVGLAQIKPRTAQTASVLAAGLTPGTVPPQDRSRYQRAEPLGLGWVALPTRPAPVPVSAERASVVAALLDDGQNLAMCGLILALYQDQWETADPSWSIRQRPEILATLYQIGFARSKPHAAPRSNAFGERVAAIHAAPWMAALLR